MLPQIKNILVGTDFSHSAWQAMKYAVLLAKVHQAKINVLHVLPDLPQELNSSGVSKLLSFGPGLSGVPPILHSSKKGAGQTGAESGEFVEKIESVAKDKIKSVLLKLKSEEPDYNWDTKMDRLLVRIGGPVQNILEELKTGDYDLAVLGRRGHGKLRGPRTGGVAQGVLNRSPVPVLVVTPEQAKAE
jgi:nucleotide-binding universal stress UspA family protein